MDLIFLGSGEFGLLSLAALAAGHRVRAVVTQPDRPAGRGGRTTPTPVGAWAQTNLPGAPLLKPERIGEGSVVARLRAIAAGGDPPAVLVVIAYGQKLPQALLEGLLAINLHASLLPRWRGAGPINAAILAGDTVTGNSVITVGERMDAGAVLGQTRRPIERDTTAGELHDLLAADGPALLERVLRDHRAGHLSPITQDETLVTRAPKLSKTDGWVDFARPADEVRRRINGLAPWPGVTIQLRGEPLRLLKATTPEVPPTGARAPGAVMDPQHGLIACAEETALQLLQVQPTGKRVMAWADFANGHRVKSDEVLVGGAPRC